VDFTLGRREPVTEAEKELKKEIDQIKKERGFIEIPNDL
jgi:hypothetical protein